MYYISTKEIIGDVGYKNEIIPQKSVKMPSKYD